MFGSRTRCAPRLKVHLPDAQRVTRPRPLVFVHGMWHASWCWREHFRAYFSAAGYPVYEVDLRGHGGSEGREALRGASVVDFVADLVAVTSQLAPSPILVGHSMGARIVQLYLEQQRAAAAVLLAPVPPGGVWRATLRILRRHPVEFARAIVHRRVYEVVANPDVARTLLFSRETGHDVERVRRYHRQLQDDSFRAFLDLLAGARTRPELVTVPVLVIGGEADALFPPRDIAATARAYRVTPVMFRGLGHDVMLEPGWRDVANSIAQWLERQHLG